MWRGVLDTLHTFTDRVIRERKAELAAEKVHKVANPNMTSVYKRPLQDEDVNEDEVGVKRRLAFLDLLIEASQGGTVLSDADIREEVGGLSFAFALLLYRLTLSCSRATTLRRPT